VSKNKAKVGNKRYLQGTYVLQNTEKYLGDPSKIFYRSSWELAFCRFCDMNDKIRKWSSEQIEIPYHISNGIGQTEIHRYYPDFYMEMVRDGDKEFYDRVIVEIKPKRSTYPPNPPKKKTLKMLENYEYSLKTYKKDIHKWAYAKEWCKKRNLKFIIITEDDLKKRGLIPNR
jgi:hypothetical protein